MYGREWLEHCEAEACYQELSRVMHEVRDRHSEKAWKTAVDKLRTDTLRCPVCVQGERAMMLNLAGQQMAAAAPPPVASSWLEQVTGLGAR